MSRWRSTRDDPGARHVRYRNGYPVEHPDPGADPVPDLDVPPYPGDDPDEQDATPRRMIAVAGVGLVLAGGLAGTCFVVSGGLSALVPGAASGSVPADPPSPVVRPGVPVVAPGASPPAASPSPVIPSGSPATAPRPRTTGTVPVLPPTAAHPAGPPGGPVTGPGCGCVTVPAPPSDSASPSPSPSATASDSRSPDPSPSEQQ